MTSIQVVLIFFCLFAAILSTVVFRSKLGYRLLAVFFFATGAAFVLFPNTTNSIAHVLGVGRGADLLLYTGLFAGIHGFLLMYLRTRRLEEKITQLVRAMAIRDAEYLGDPTVKPLNS